LIRLTGILKALNTLKEVKNKFPNIDVIVGNIATPEATLLKTALMV
jgi:hypothetical protein